MPAIRTGWTAGVPPAYGSHLPPDPEPARCRRSGPVGPPAS